MTNPPEFQVSSGGALALPAVTVARKSPSRLFWERLRQDKAALAGGVVIVLLILIARRLRHRPAAGEARPLGRRAQPLQAVEPRDEAQ